MSTWDRFVLRTIAVALLAAGLYGASLGTLRARRIAASWRWPVTEGELLEAEVVDDGGSEAPYTLRVRYRYTAAGERRRGRRVSPGGAMFHQSGSAELRAIRDDLRSRTPLQVRVDPADPRSSAVYTGLLEWDVAMALAGLSGLAAAAGVAGSIGCFLRGDAGGIRPLGLDPLQPLRGPGRWGAAEAAGALTVTETDRAWWRASLWLAGGLLVAPLPVLMCGSELARAIRTPGDLMVAAPAAAAVAIALAAYRRAFRVVRYRFAQDGRVDAIARGGARVPVAAPGQVRCVRVSTEVTPPEGEGPEIRRRVLELRAAPDAGDPLVRMEWLEISMSQPVLEAIGARIAALTHAELAASTTPAG